MDNFTSVRISQVIRELSYPQWCFESMFSNLQSMFFKLQQWCFDFWHFLISNFEPIFNWISLPFMVQEMGQNWVSVCLPRTLHNKSPKLIGIFRFRQKFWDSCCIGRFSISRNKILKIWIEMVYEPLQCCFKIKI
jgi:hypothetical protein